MTICPICGQRTDSGHACASKPDYFGHPLLGSGYDQGFKNGYRKGQEEMREEMARLREALKTICDIGETRDVLVARAALDGMEGA